jgi:hypothetical protein
MKQLADQQIDITSCLFYLRFKSFFVIYHSTIYDHPFKCQSYIVSYTDPLQQIVNYGNIIVFVQLNLQFYAFIQKYRFSERSLSQYIDIPSSLHSKVNELFPLVELSDEFILISVERIRHKCVKIPFDGVFCLSEIRLHYEHD